jgi:hypothetical protein
MIKEPFSYPSRQRFPYNPGVPDKQLWAIGMVVVQWGMTEFLREQITFNVVANDESLIQKYSKLRHSNQKTAFWKDLVESKLQEPSRSKYLEFISRFEMLNNQRDDIIHRLWGGGLQPSTFGAPDNAPVTDAALHRHRDETMKTKSTDARANIRWRLTFVELRRIANNMAQLNRDIFASFLPPGTHLGSHNVWAALMEGKLEVLVSAITSKGDPDV